MPDTRPPGEGRLTILANSNVSRGKFAAAAVHAALAHYGMDHGAVIVLGAKPGDIEEECELVIRDAGRTEVTPGTVTAGVRAPTTEKEEPPMDPIEERIAAVEAEMAQTRQRLLTKAAKDRADRAARAELAAQVDVHAAEIERLRGGRP